MIRRLLFEDDDSQWGLLDILFIMLLGFIVMFYIAIQHMNPVSLQTQNDPKAEYLITMTWQSDSHDDVDLWVQDPTGAKVSFRDKEVNLMHLDRDDLGSSSDTMIMPGGKIVTIHLNREVVSLRGIVPGWWTVNAHLYSNKDKNPDIVSIEVTRINPYLVLDIFEAILEKAGDEKTFIRFHLAPDGTMLDKNRLSKKLFEGVAYGGDTF